MLWFRKRLKWIEYCISLKSSNFAASITGLQEVKVIRENEIVSNQGLETKGYLSKLKREPDNNPPGDWGVECVR